MVKKGVRRERRSSGGGANSQNRLSVFDFDRDDSRVEAESAEIVAKYWEKRPRKKFGRDDQQHVDKNVFLEAFEKGEMTRRNDSENDVMDVDIPEMFSNEKLNLDTKENSIMDSRLSTSHSYLSDNEGLHIGMSGFSSLEGQESYDDAMPNDCEPVVVISTKYAKFGNVYYTGCIFIFSQTCVRLDYSTPCDRKRSRILEWPTSDILQIEYHHDETVEASIVVIHFKSGGENGSKVMNGNSGFVDLEVVIDDPKWSEKQEEIKSLDSKYRAVWTTILSEMSFDEPFGDVLYPGGDPDAVSITSKDIRLLRPKTFINDTIIDFYIKYLVNRLKPEERHRFHFFNTFFFQKLFQDYTQAREGKESFQSFHKWTKNVDLSLKDYVFIPVNLSLHWSLIVICYPGQIPTDEGLGSDKSFKIPCILHMDSLRGSHRVLENCIRRYLWEDWKQHHHDHGKDVFTKFDNLDFIKLKLPQQENFFDCGLFLLHYAELFLEHVSNFRLANFYGSLNEGWFHPAEVTLKKRNQIRKLIRKIADDNSSVTAGFCSGENKSTGCGPTEVESNNSYIAIEHISDDGHNIRLQKSGSGNESLFCTEVVDLLSCERASIELNEGRLHPAEVTPKKCNEIRKPIPKIADDSSPVVAGFCIGESKLAGCNQREVESNNSHIEIENISDDGHNIRVQRPVSGNESLFCTEVVDLLSSERASIKVEDASQPDLSSRDRINEARSSRIPLIWSEDDIETCIVDDSDEESFTVVPESPFIDIS